MFESLEAKLNTHFEGEKEREHRVGTYHNMKKQKKKVGYF